MRLEYDEEADAAYLYFSHPIPDGTVEQTTPIAEGLNADLDSEGRLLGLEMLNASRRVTPKALEESHST